MIKSAPLSVVSGTIPLSRTHTDSVLNISPASLVVLLVAVIAAIAILIGMGRRILMFEGGK